MDTEIPDSRSYVHKTCGEVTEADGGDFKNLACPVPGMIGTKCGACGQMFLVSEFHWEDTGENLTDYYERYRAQVSGFMRLICSRQLSIAMLVIGLLAGIGIGIWSGMSLGVMWGIIIGFVATLICGLAGLIGWDMMTARLLSGALGVPDLRCLK